MCKNFRQQDKQLLKNRNSDKHKQLIIKQLILLFQYNDIITS